MPTVLLRGPSSSTRRTLCHVPSVSLPSCTGIVSVFPSTIERRWLCALAGSCVSNRRRLDLHRCRSLCWSCCPAVPHLLGPCLPPAGPALRRLSHVKVVVQVWHGRRCEARQELAHVVHEPRLVFVDGQRGCGVPRHDVDEALAHASLGNRLPDGRRDVEERDSCGPGWKVSKRDRRDVEERDSCGKGWKLSKCVKNPR